MQFTKKIKKKWLNKLKSGEYTQAFNCFTSFDYKLNKNTHCCIAVLEECLDNDNSCYRILEVIDDKIVGKLISINDNPQDRNIRDYSNVIPIIEQIPTID